MDTQAVTASALAGASTGARSFTALGLLVAATPPDSTEQPDRALAHPAVKALVGLVTVQELVMDKLPNTPSRLEILGIGTRLLGAAASGVIIARRRAAQRKALAAGPSDGLAATPPGEPPEVDDGPIPTAICAGAAAAAAVATARAGVRWRGWCTKTTKHDWIGASVEDGATVGLAAAAVRAIG